MMVTKGMFIFITYFSFAYLAVTAFYLLYNIVKSGIGSTDSADKHHTTAGGAK